MKLTTLFFVSSVVVICKCLKLISIEKTFQKGVQAYGEERWSRCIENFEESLHLYKLYKSVVINCRLKCSAEEPKSQIKENLNDLKIYEYFFNKRDCITKCQEVGFHNMHMNSTLDDDTHYDMQIMKPYAYLHICYYQMHMFHLAASSAYTYLLINPNDEIMRSNLKYYLQQPEVDVNDLVDLESSEYKVLYALGKKSYNNDNWAETVASMEEVLKDYIDSENNCRVECECQPGQEWSSEFVVTISNNIASLLHCHQQCQEKLKTLQFDSGIQFLAEVLNYLQISYYHLEKYEDAAKAVASHLVLIPLDEDMLSNREFYGQHVDETAFIPFPDVVYYAKRDAYEKSLLDFFHQGKNDRIDNNFV